MLKRLLILLFTFSTAALSQTVLHCGSLLDVKSGQYLRGAYITIDGEKIGAISNTAPANVNVIDLANETCLPGLIDTHTHVLLQGDITAEDYDVQLLEVLRSRIARSWPPSPPGAPLNTGSPPSATSKPKAPCTPTSTLRRPSTRA